MADSFHLMKYILILINNLSFDLFLGIKSSLAALYCSALNFELPIIQLPAIVQAMTSADRIRRAA